MALQLQTPSLLRSPAGQPTLRSAFYAPPLWVRLPPGRAASARITMRFGGMALKQAYICRDYGYIYKDKTPFKKLSDDYFYPGSTVVSAASKRKKGDKQRKGKRPMGIYWSYFRYYLN